jgi:hypothetical protein
MAASRMGVYRSKVGLHDRYLDGLTPGGGNEETVRLWGQYR